MATTYTFKGYAVTVYENQSPPVDVFSPNGVHVMYATTSLDRAMHWIEAYRNGEQWAIDAKLSK